MSPYSTKELKMKLRNVLAGVAATVALCGGAVAQPQGMWPGMMGGYGGGYGMGPGIMGGGYGMGQGMMFGYTNDAYGGLNLTPEQRKTISAIHEQTFKAMWQHMGAMHGHDYHMHGLFGSGPLDEAEARKSFQAMTDTQKAMFEMQLDARKKIDGVLTKEQREKLGRNRSGR
jgi:Spy/CpxP family protein refolding chaperone